VWCWDRKTFEELDPLKIAVENGWSSVKTFEFPSLEVLKIKLNDANPFKIRGYVLFDKKTCNRVRISSKYYIALEVSPDPNDAAPLNLEVDIDDRGVYQIARQCNMQIFLLYYPEHTVRCNHILNLFESVAAELESVYAPIKSFNRRYYGEAGGVHWFKRWLWEMKNGMPYVNAREFLCLCKDTTFFEVLALKKQIYLTDIFKRIDSLPGYM